MHWIIVANADNSPTFLGATNGDLLHAIADFATWYTIL
jgi:hypothetical protein